MGLEEKAIPVLFRTPIGIYSMKGKLINRMVPLTVPILVPYSQSYSSKSASC